MRFKPHLFFCIEILIIGLISLSTTIAYNIGPVSDDRNILVIDGHGKPVHFSNIERWQLIILQNAPDTIIENLTYNDGSTILVVSSDNLVVRNNIIKNANSYALFVEFSDNVQIYNNTIESGSHDGLISYRNNHVIIDNNRISGVVKNGIFARGNNVTISNNQINDIAGTGIFIEGSTDLVVESNSINNVDWTPIAPDQTSFDLGTFSENTNNGIALTVDDINPSITNSVSNVPDITTSDSGNNNHSTDEFTNTSDNVKSSTDETYSPFLIIVFGMAFLTFLRKIKKIIN